MPDVAEALAEARRRIATSIKGLETNVTLLLVALGARGHVLMEGVPGVGKTTLAKAFAQVSGLRFGRIQLTPDLMPTEITGHLFYNQKSGEFETRLGPVFTNVLLADELNRTPPRTQSALLEVMQEGQVTIEGETHPVPQPFLVVATRNPIEVEGVYPIPEAERDRFMLHTVIEYPGRAAESAMLAAKIDGADIDLRPVEGLAEAFIAAADRVRVHDVLRDYALDIIEATRSHDAIAYGASPRAAEHLLRAARAHAAMEGRDYVVPDDIRDLALPVLRHRLLLTTDAEADQVDVARILDEILAGVKVPIE